MTHPIDKRSCSTESESTAVGSCRLSTVYQECEIFVDGEYSQVDGLRLVVLGHVMLEVFEAFCIILIEHAFVLSHGCHVRLDGVG